MTNPANPHLPKIQAAQLSRTLQLTPMFTVAFCSLVNSLLVDVWVWVWYPSDGMFDLMAPEPWPTAALSQGKEKSTMLVLSRKPGERILIGDEIAVTVVRIGPNTVRLGIDAPRNMNIVRDELCHPEIEVQGSEKVAAQR